MTARSGAFVCAVMALAFAACGGSAPENTCPSDLPATCPDASLRYSDVEPLFATYCVRCHSAGGQAQSRPLATYEDVFAQRSAALNQLYSCKMPLPGEPAPTGPDRARLLGWFVCGAPK